MMLLVAVLTCSPALARVQLGELHVGGLVSYGAAHDYRLGAGLVLGVAAGRLAYTGVRWAYQTGSTRSVASGGSAVEVTSRVQVFALDLGLQIPAGAFEIVPGASLGAARFAQRTKQPGPGGQLVTAGDHVTNFFAAPSLSVQVRVSRVLVIPELQYFLAGDPDFAWPAPHRGPVATVRIVATRELARIRR
jgi:hypothetical protein